MNKAIDEVARQMTEEAPPSEADFRRFVLARIASNEAPRAPWPAAFVLSPIAIAAAIVIVVMFVRRPGPLGTGASQPAPTVATVPADIAGPKGPALHPAAANTVRLKPDTTEVRRPDPFGPGVSGRQGSSRFGGGRSEPQLDPIEVDAIAPAPLVVDTLAPNPIPIERIETITPVTVAPLESITEIQRREE